MRPIPCLAAPLLFLATLVVAADQGVLIFQDDFSRQAPAGKGDEPGQGWTTNSKARAKGNRQVELRDGAMHIFIHPEADHAVSVGHAMEFRDGAVALRFRLDHEQDSLGLDFADPACPDVHAGHLFAARVTPKQVQFQDLKTGNMRKDIQAARQAKQALNPEQRQALVGKNSNVSRRTELGRWHELLVTVSGDELSVSIDGALLGSLRSPGIGHPTKKLLRLAVPRQAVVDDVRIWRRG
jgi:hypothetical protein